MKKKLTVLLAILFIGFVGLGAYDLRNNQIELKLKDIKLQDSVLELNKIELEKQELNKKFDEAVKNGNVNQEKVQQLEKEKLELEQKTRELEQQLQAKRAEQAKIASVGVTQKASAQPVVSGNKQEWLVASGIPESEWWAVDSIVSRESSWNPNAVNPSSGACGLGQQLPCGKWAGAWNDPVAALKAQYAYVVARYGGYPQAVAFWNANHWY